MPLPAHRRRRRRRRRRRWRWRRLRRCCWQSELRSLRVHGGLEGLLALPGGLLLQQRPPDRALENPQEDLWEVKIRLVLLLLLLDRGSKSVLCWLILTTTNKQASRQRASPHSALRISLFCALLGFLLVGSARHRHSRPRPHPLAVFPEKAEREKFSSVHKDPRSSPKWPVYCG